MSVFQKPFSFASIFLLGACFVSSSCGKFKQPEFRDVKNVSLANFSKDASMKLQLVCYNPNKYGATVKNTRCSLYVNQVFLGEFMQDSSIRVARKSDFVLPVSLKLNSKEMLGLLPSLMGDSTVVKVNGSTRVGKSGFFSTYPIEYEGVQHLNLFK
jgi:LEA14-like dessication related protein